MGNIQQLSSAKLMYEMMQNGDWERAAHVMVGSGLENIQDMSPATGERGLKLLHAMCRFQPPDEIVEFTLHKCPDQAHKIDEKGRFPLHYAARHGSRSAVVKALLSANPSAAMHIDESGRLPLHHACQPKQWSVDDDSENDEYLAMQPGSAVIMALCKVAPASANIEDRDGYNALELAIHFDLSYKICQILMESSDKAWKEMKRKEEEWKKRRGPINEGEQRRILRDLPPYDEMLKRWRREQQLRRNVTESNRIIAPNPSDEKFMVDPKSPDEMHGKKAKNGPVDDSYRTTVQSSAA